MRLTYNGIELRVLRTLQMERSNVYDESGQDVLYQCWDIKVIATLNPRSTSFTGGFDNNGVRIDPTAQIDHSPVLTDRAIRHELMEQRKNLVVTGDRDNQAAGGTNTVLLRSPNTDRAFTVDARGGPYPQDFDIIGVWGAPKTLVVYYHIRTYINECADYQNEPIISHRWRQREDVDRDHASLRLTEGTVVFNMAEMVRLGRIPDQFRQDFLHPVPANFQRWHVEVTVRADGTTCDYTVLDRQRTHNLNPDGACTEIEAYHTENIHQPSLAGAAMAAARGFIQMMADQAAVAGQADIAGPAAALARFPFAAGLFAFDTIMAALPKCYSSLFIRGWGDRNTPRQDIANAIMLVAAGRLTDFAINGLRLALLPSIDATLTRDLTGKFAEFQLTVQHPPSAASIFAAIATAVVFTQDKETLTGPLGAGGVFVAPGDGVNPRFPNSNQSRGRWLGNILAQALDPACERSSKPVLRKEEDLSIHPA